MNARILAGTPAAPKASATTKSVDSAWRAVAGFGLVLALIGVGQVALYFYPAGFGSPEWQFGTAAQVLGSLPLPTMGLGALLAALYALRVRWGLVSVSVILLLGALATLAVLGMFWTVAPQALRGAPEIAAGTIRQTAARTTLNGVGFSVLYMWAAIATLLHAKRLTRS